MTTGEKIAFLRKQKGYSQADLAQKIYVSDKAVSKWENDRGKPDINTLPYLAKELGVSIEELIIEDEIENDETVETENTYQYRDKSGILIPSEFNKNELKKFYKLNYFVIIPLSIIIMLIYLQQLNTLSGIQINTVGVSYGGILFTIIFQFIFNIILKIVFLQFLQKKPHYYAYYLFVVSVISLLNKLSITGLVGICINVIIGLYIINVIKEGAKARMYLKLFVITMVIINILPITSLISIHSLNIEIGNFVIGILLGIISGIVSIFATKSLIIALTEGEVKAKFN